MNGRKRRKVRPSEDVHYVNLSLEELEDGLDPVITFVTHDEEA